MNHRKLDPAMSDEIMALLQKINREEQTTIVMVTHDLPPLTNINILLF